MNTVKPLKILFDTELNAMEVSDIEHVGTVRFDEKGNASRWVKNRNATAITSNSPVCYDLDDLGVLLFDRINIPATKDITSHIAAGITRAAFGVSGSTVTGCFGWIAVQGYFKDAKVLQPATGGTAITSGSELVPVAGAAYLAYAGTAAAAAVYSRHFRSLEGVATITGAIVTSRDVQIFCL